MKKILFLFLFFSFNISISYANTYIETSVDWYDFQVIEYDKTSKLYDIKIAISNSGASLSNILKENNGISWVNWVFFCPADYVWMCKWRENTTNNERYVAGEKIAKYDETWNRVVFAWDKYVNTFLYQTNIINLDKEKDIYYWFSNWPLLLKNWVSQTKKYWDLGLIDNKMKLNWTRNFICSNIEDSRIYFWFVKSINIDKLAIVLKKFWCYNALSIDAWYSSAFLYNWRYIKWPGRDIIDSVYISPKWFNILDLEEKIKQMSKLILKNISWKNIYEQIEYLEKMEIKLINYKNIFYEQYSTDIFHKDIEWNLLNNGYKIDINSNKALKQIYIINSIWKNLNQILNILEKIQKINLDNDLNIKINMNLLFN
jgi:hypothetical protein